MREEPCSSAFSAPGVPAHAVKRVRHPGRLFLDDSFAGERIQTADVRKLSFCFMHDPSLPAGKLQLKQSCIVGKRLDVPGPGTSACRS